MLQDSEDPSNNFETLNLELLNNFNYYLGNDDMKPVKMARSGEAPSPRVDVSSSDELELVESVNSLLGTLSRHAISNYYGDEITPVGFGPTGGRGPIAPHESPLDVISPGRSHKSDHGHGHGHGPIGHGHHGNSPFLRPDGEFYFAFYHV